VVHCLRFEIDRQQPALIAWAKYQMPAWLCRKLDGTRSVSVRSALHQNYPEIAAEIDKLIAARNIVDTSPNTGLQA